MTAVPERCTCCCESSGLGVARGRRENFQTPHAARVLVQDDPTSPKIPERRKHPRVAATIEIRFSAVQEAAKALRAFSVNLSVGGLCLKTQKPYRVGSELQLLIDIEGESFEVVGVVAWARGGALGVRFTELSDGDKERLRRILAAMGQNR
jgi:uncharacterized protein (TIGR02266 family)